MFCQRGLSGTVVSQNGDKISGFHGKVHAVHRFYRRFDLALFIHSYIFKFKIFTFYNIHLLLPSLETGSVTLKLSTLSCQIITITIGKSKGSGFFKLTWSFFS